MLIIGLIGSISSGKHLIAEILREQHGFLLLEFKDFKNNQNNAAKSCLSKAEETWPKNIVIIGIDSLAAIHEMSDNSQFFPIAVEGPLLLRYQRQKHSNIHSLEEFIKIDDHLQFGTEIDKELLEKYHLNRQNMSPLNRCIEMCNLRLTNDSNNQKQLEIELAKTLSVESNQQQLTKTNIICPNWDQYFLMVAWITAAHGNCVRHPIGCIIADCEQRIVATGYNGTPTNIKACNQGGCKRCWDMSIGHGERLDECICVHAEESALLEAGRRQCQNATLYVTHNPCRQCSKKIIQSGIKSVVYCKEYPASLNDIRQLFQQANIQLIQQKLSSIPLFQLNK